MRLKYIVVVGVLITFLCSIAFILIKREEVVRLKKSNKELTYQNSNYALSLHDVQKYESLAYKHNSAIIANVTVTDTDRKVYNLDQIVGEGKLVFNTTSLNCSECFAMILELFKKYKNNDLILLFNTDNPRAFMYFVKNNEITIPAYTLDLLNTLFPSEIENLPCFFTIDKNLKISNVFFPLKNDTAFTEKYLTTILKKKSLL